MKLTIITIILSITTILGCKSSSTHATLKKEKPDMQDSTAKLSEAIFGAGCFWCVEAVFQRLKGVEKVLSGYTGGKTKNPTYEQVCAGATGHAEVCKIYYNTEEISYEDLVEVFFTTHDPTTLNRQGNDVGTQYRSAIFYSDENEKNIALAVKEKFEMEKIYDAPIITEIARLGEFYVAENYHQNYFDTNPNQPYCMFVINPKVDKFKKKFRDKLK